jgi:hypothetical protein
MKTVSVIVLGMMLTACAATVPIIDQAGKDPVQLNRDLAACQRETADTFSWGNPIANCMKKKGYRPIGIY